MSMRETKENIDSKLFNGYIVEPIPIVFLVVFVGIAFLVLAIWGTWDILVSNNQHEIFVHECIIAEYQNEGLVYELISGEGDLFCLPKRSIDDISTLDNLVFKKTVVVMLCESPTNKNDKYLTVLEISNTNGMPIIDRDTINMAWSKNARDNLLVLWSACIIYWSLALGGYYILSNAPRYPHISKILIRKHFRNF